MQQLIIVDMAYNWNDSWVEKANQAEQEGVGRGKRWLIAIVLSCFIVFAVALAGLIYLFVDFTGCPSNNAFIGATLVLCVLITGAQLSGEDGSLLSSACVSAWAVYLLYSAVTKNPDSACNPMLGAPTIANIVLGLVVSCISLAYTGWSYTAEDKLTVRREASDGTGGPDAPAVASFSYQKDPEDGTKKVTGVVTGTGDDPANSGAASTSLGDGDDGGNGDDGENPDNDAAHLSNSWRLNIVLSAISCWSAVILTQWGSIASKGTVSNPSVGGVAMWMVIASQWVVLTLYLWTLVAPRLFPNRDFS